MVMLAVLLNSTAVRGDDDRDRGDDGNPHDHGDDAPPVQIHVPRQASTIQEAIDTVPDGGRVVIHAGTYHESLLIAGKDVELVGRGDARIVLPVPLDVVDYSSSLGVVNFRDGGGGSVDRLTLVGGDCGICAFITDVESDVSIRNVDIESSARGMVVVGSVALELSEVSVYDSLWHGILLVRSPTYRFSSVAIEDSGGAGFYSIDSLSPDFVCLRLGSGSLNEMTVVGNRRGGVQVFRSVLCLYESFIGHNYQAGILAQESRVTSEFNLILDTAPNEEGLFGDGMVFGPGLVGSTATILETHIEDSARAAIYNASSTVSLAETTMACSLFDIVLEVAAPGTWSTEREFLPQTSLPFQMINGGGVECGCPVADNNCEALPAGDLGPPPPADPP